MRRRRKSVRNVGDHRRGSIMARISRFYYFNAGPDRRGPRDSHTHSPDPRMGIVSFTAGCTVFFLASFATLRSRYWSFRGPREIRTLIDHRTIALTKLPIFQYFSSIIGYPGWRLWTLNCTHFYRASQVTFTSYLLRYDTFHTKASII